MPFAINDELLKPRLDDGSPNPKALQGFDKNNPPLKTIPHLEYPRCVYRYPKNPTREIVEMRGGQTYTTVVPAMAISKTVADKKEFEQALKQGWHAEPYLPPQETEAGLTADYE